MPLYAWDTSSCTPSSSRGRSGACRALVVLAVAGLLLCFAVPGPAAADGPAFVDVARDPGAGLSYARQPSARKAKHEAILHGPPIGFADVPDFPIKPHGAPGVALLDFDGDGDLDLYVTNGPGAANSLFENRLVPDGELAFHDVATALGADSTAQDSSGVCFGDADNDGDPDLLVLGSGEPNRLLENRGGRFVDATGATAGSFASEIGGGSLWSTGCSFGDVDGDGLLDVVVGNSYDDWEQQGAIFAVPFAQNEHNQLFLNRGGLVFEDVSAAAGIEALGGVPPGAATITWAIALVDLDADGDLDLVHADDQAAIPSAHYGGVDRGYLQYFENDGAGHFTNRTLAAGTDSPGQWMGLAFADYDCDGLLDVFGSNVGDYMMTAMPIPYALGDSSSRCLFQRGDGTFADPGVGGLIGTPFGWGASPLDYDADGDTDIVYHGGLDAGPLIDASNPGVLLANPGCGGELAGGFDWDAGAFASSTDHRRRNVQGVAVGDVNGDGLPDIVSVSNFDQPAPIPLVPYGTSWGAPFDPPLAAFVPIYAPTGNGDEMAYTGIVLADGSLSVEINDGAGAGRSISVLPAGSIGLATGASVNRSGIGAIVAVTPEGGATARRPVVGGASYASQDALEQPFGLGRAKKATIEVLWPGGVRNRLYGVKAGERVVFPEIPCGFDGEWASPAAYQRCVKEALDELAAAGVISPGERGRLLSSALRARTDG